MFPKLGEQSLAVFYRRWMAQSRRLANIMDPRGKFSLVVPKTAGYYIAAYEEEMERTNQLRVRFMKEADCDLAMLLLNSNCFFWLWRVLGDGFHVTLREIESCPLPSSTDESFRVIAAKLRRAIPECTVFKAYRGKQIPNVNFNRRMDLLWEADEWILRSIAPDLGLTPLDFVWAKSNSFLSLQVPKSACWPHGFEELEDRRGGQVDDDD
jgi:hypothetical protein